MVTVKAVSAIFQVAFGMFSATVAGGVNILNQFINYTNDESEIDTVPSPNSGNPGIEKKPTFTEYIDKKSVFTSMGSAALFAPLALGANIAVGAAFKGAGAGSAASAANAIASFYTGGSVSMLQYVAETMLYLFE